MAHVEPIDRIVDPNRKVERVTVSNDNPDDLYNVLRDLKAGVEKIYQQCGAHPALAGQGHMGEMLRDLSRDVDMLNETVLRYTSVCPSDKASLLCQTIKHPPLHILEGESGPWMRWWAWYPVKLTVSNETVWGRWVEVRKFHAAIWFLDGNRWWWEYRDVKTDVPT